MPCHASAFALGSPLLLAFLPVGGASKQEATAAPLGVLTIRNLRTGQPTPYARVSISPRPEDDRSADGLVGASYPVNEFFGTGQVLGANLEPRGILRGSVLPSEGGPSRAADVFLFEEGVTEAKIAQPHVQDLNPLRLDPKGPPHTFEFGAFRPGRYTLFASARGFESIWTTVEVEAGAAVVRPVTLPYAGDADAVTVVEFGAGVKMICDGEGTRADRWPQRRGTMAGTRQRRNAERVFGEWVSRGPRSQALIRPPYLLGTRLRTELRGD